MLEAKTYNGIKAKKIEDIEYPFEIYHISTVNEDNHVGFLAEQNKSEKASPRDFNPKIYEIMLYLKVYWAAKKLQ